MSSQTRPILKLAGWCIAVVSITLYSTGAFAESSVSSGARAPASAQVRFKIVIPPYIGVTLDESGRQRAVSNIRQFTVLEEFVGASARSSVAESVPHRLIAYP